MKYLFFCLILIHYSANGMQFINKLFSYAGQSSPSSSNNLESSDQEIMQRINNVNVHVKHSRIRYGNSILSIAESGDLVLGSIPLTSVKKVSKFSFTDDNEMKNDLNAFENSIEMFTISPNQEYLAALQVLKVKYNSCANGIWIVDLKKMKASFKPLPKIFSQAVIKSNMDEYCYTYRNYNELFVDIDNGKWYKYLMFKKIALSNEGVLALNVGNKTIFLHSNQEEPFMMHEFKMPQESLNHLFIEEMAFNNKGTQFGIKYREGSDRREEGKVEFVQITQ